MKDLTTSPEARCSQFLKELGHINKRIHKERRHIQSSTDPQQSTREYICSLYDAFQLITNYLLTEVKEELGGDTRREPSQISSSDDLLLSLKLFADSTGSPLEITVPRTGSERINEAFQVFKAAHTHSLQELTFSDEDLETVNTVYKWLIRTTFSVLKRSRRALEREIDGLDQNLSQLQQGRSKPMAHKTQDEVNLVHSALTRLDDIRREYGHVADLQELWDDIDQAWRKRFHTIIIRGFPSSKGELIVKEYPEKVFPFSTEEEFLNASIEAREYAEERETQRISGQIPNNASMEDE